MSNPRSSKKEFIGMIRNIFNNAKPSSKRNIIAHQEFLRDKKSFRKKIKSKLSFLRVDSIKLGRDRSQKIKYSPEWQRRFGRTSATSNLNFENIDETFNLSSILKHPNTSRSTIQKSLRFVENTSAMECSSENIVDMSLSNISISTDVDITNDQSTIIESDGDYYRRMKKKILSTHKSVTISKPKRNMSVKLKNDVLEAAQGSITSIIPDGYYFSPENESSIHDNGNDDIFKDNNEKYGITTHITTLLSPVTQPQNNFEYTFRDSHGYRKPFSNILLQKWQFTDDERYTETSGDSNEAASLIEIQNSDSKCNDFSQFFFSRYINGAFASVERDYDDRNRYDPMPETERCAISLYRDQSLDCGRTSWCSVSS